MVDQASDVLPAFVADMDFPPRAAWTEPDADEWLEQARAVLTRNRDRVVEAVTGWDGVEVTRPEATYLAGLDCRALVGDDPCCRFLEEVGVALAHGPDFGADGRGWARLNVATSAGVLDEILTRLGRAVSGPGPGGP